MGGSFGSSFFLFVVEVSAKKNKKDKKKINLRGTMIKIDQSLKM